MGEALALVLFLMFGSSKKKKSDSPTSTDPTSTARYEIFFGGHRSGVASGLTWDATKPSGTNIGGTASSTLAAIEAAVLNSIEGAPSNGAPVDIVGDNGITANVYTQGDPDRWYWVIKKNDVAQLEASKTTRREAVDALFYRLGPFVSGGETKLPDDATPSAPSWSGRIGAVNFTVRRATGSWQAKVDGAPTPHATAALALRAAMLRASQKAGASMPLFLIADPFVFEGIASRQPGVVQTWKWHVRVPEAGTTILDGTNDALAEGNSPTRNDALGEVFDFARPYTEGKTAHG